MRKSTELLCLFLAALAVYAWVNDPGHVYTADAHISTQNVNIHFETYAPDQTPGHNIFNPTAQIDTSQVVTSDTDYPVLLPDYANEDTTPTVLQDGVYIPEEAPDGGHFIQWLDNSPHYSDGYTLLVNDSQSPITVSWRYDGNGA